MLPQAAVCSQAFPDLRLMRHQPRAPATEQGSKEDSPGYPPQEAQRRGQALRPGRAQFCGQAGPGQIAGERAMAQQGSALGLQSAHSTTAAASSKAGTASQKAAAAPSTGSAPQQPAETSFRGDSRFATEVATSHGHAEPSTPALEALPGGAVKCR